MAAYSMSASTVGRVRHEIEKARNLAARIRHKAQEKAGETKEILEVQGACAATAYLAGRIETATGKPLEVFGVPVDMAVGTLLLAGAIFDMGGRYDEDLLHVGNGVLAGWTARKAHALGVSASKEGRFLGAGPNWWGAELPPVYKDYLEEMSGEPQYAIGRRHRAPRVDGNGNSLGRRRRFGQDVIFGAENDAQLADELRKFM